MSNGKLFLGQRLRRLRRDREMSQTDMAGSLSISPSYLNHLERNQRPVTAGLLLKLAEVYEIDVRTFAAGGAVERGAPLCRRSGRPAGVTPAVRGHGSAAMPARGRRGGVSSAMRAPQLGAVTSEAGGHPPGSG